MTWRDLKIWYHPNFRKSYAALPIGVQRKAEAREKLFRQNPFHPLLRTHRPKGRLADLYSFSIDARYRIVFRFYRGEVLFLDIGDHDIYRGRPA